MVPTSDSVVGALPAQAPVTSDGSNHSTGVVSSHPPTDLALTVHSDSSKGNVVDGWIDDLDLTRSATISSNSPDGISPTGMISYLVAQNLPKMTLPTFDGSALHWVEFIMKFRDVVHNQEYLSDVQRHQLLVQHLKDEAKKAVKSYANDPRGYVLSLKRLKYLFGQRPMIARAVLAKVTKGKAVQGDDVQGVAALYYDITDCLSTLDQLDYSSDLYSSETLHQTVQRLPHWLVKKWAERSMGIRRKGEEPNLIHLEQWLLEKILVMKEPCLSESRPKPKPNNNGNKNKKEEKPPSKFVGSMQKEADKCRICEADHIFWKCSQYVAMVPLKRYRLVSKFKICYNCLGDHKREDCTSTNTCFKEGCSAKHHTTLHEYFLEGMRIRKAKRQRKGKNGQKKDGETPNKNQAKAGDDAKKEEKKDTSASSTSEAGAKDEKKEEVLVGMIRKPKKDVFLQVIPLTISGPKKSVETFGVLDSCSEVTFVRDDIAKELELTRTSDTIILKPSMIRRGPRSTSYNSTLLLVGIGV